MTSDKLEPLRMRRLVSADEEFVKQLNQLIAWEEVSDASVLGTVEAILRDIRVRGDSALVEYTNKFDRRSLVSAAEFCVGEGEIAAALNEISTEQRAVLEKTARRIHSYHERQRQESWSYREADGTMLGQQISPIERVGIYVPGGKAAIPPLY